MLEREMVREGTGMEEAEGYAEVVEKAVGMEAAEGRAETVWV